MCLSRIAPYQLSSLQSIMKEQNFQVQTKWDVNHYACSFKWKSSVWTCALLPWDAAWNANAPQCQRQSAGAESCQREVGCGSCDALTSHGNRSREWQAGVSSLTWVEQREGKALHLPWSLGGKKGGRRKARMKWCVCVCFRWVFLHAWGLMCVWCSFLSEVRMASTFGKNMNAQLKLLWVKINLNVLFVFGVCMFSLSFTHCCTV